MDADVAGSDAYAQDRRYLHPAELLPATGPGHDALDGPQLANAWERQIGDTISDLSGTRNIEHLDVLLATPVELAVMILSGARRIPSNA